MAPNHPHLRAASPKRPATFDPWNSVGRGHQRAELNAGQSVGWRASREAKLQAQFQDGLGGDGGERMYDLVGRGAKDDGLGWAMKRGRIDKGEEENRRLNIKGELRHETGEAGETIKALLAGEKGKVSRKELALWDGKVREEKICLDVGEKGEKRRKRGREGVNGDEDEDPDKGENKKAKVSVDTAPAMKKYVDDYDKPMITDHYVYEAKIMAAEDSDDVWDEDVEEEEEMAEEGRDQEEDPDQSRDQDPDQDPNQDHNPKQDQDRDITHAAHEETEIQQPLPHKDLEVTSNKPSTTINQNDKRQIARPNTPPSGQTRYPSRSPSPPPPQQTTTAPKKTGRPPPVVSQSTTAIIRNKPKQIFTGLTVHVSGPTLPLISDHALRGLLIQHGATLMMHLARRRLTHVILGRPTSSSSSDGSSGFSGAGATFAASKLQKEMHRIRSATGGPGIRFVSIEWVLESIKVGRRLSEARFGIGMEQEHAEKTAQSGPLSKEERDAIGSEVVPPANAAAATAEKRREDRRAKRAREMDAGDGKAANNAFQKGIASRTAAMPGAPPGVPSVRSMFLKQHRDNAWTKAGFVMKK